MLCVSKVESSPQVLLEYQTRIHSQTIQYYKEMSEEDREEETPQIVPPHLFLSSFGLGSYYYFMMVKNLHFCIPFAYSIERLLVCCLPYISALLKHPKSCLKGIELGTWIVQRISPHSIILRSTTPYFVMSDDEEALDIEHSIYFVFCQDLITFMVNCPIASIRTQAYHLFQGYLSIFTNSERFELIKRIITNCPYPSFVGLVVHRLKQEVEWAWALLPDTNTKSTSSIPFSYPPSFPSPILSSSENTTFSPFLSSKVLYLLSLLQSENSPLSRLDILMNVLSVYRFLLIRDKTSNFTGIWEKEKVQQIRDNFLNPLFKVVNKELKKLSSPPSKEEQETQQRVAHQHGLPALTSDQLIHLHDTNIMNLQLLKDTILRVIELMKGSEPMKGVPDVQEKKEINKQEEN